MKAARKTTFKRLLFITWLAFCFCMSFCFAQAETLTSAHEAELEQKATAVLDYLNLYGKDNYDIVFGVYNYICQTVEYDWASTDSLLWDGVSLGRGQFAYEALCQEKAVCAGISRAIEYLLTKMGIPCKTAIGIEKYGIAHAWNFVNLGGKWYLMDATNDLGKSEYKYFLKTWEDEEFVGYGVSSESGFNAADLSMASSSYRGNVSSQMDSYGGFKFNIGLGDITIFSYTGTDTNLVIPSEIKGRKVKRLAQYFILENNSIETLTISEGIERISSLFAGHCWNLKSISIPSTANIIAVSSGGISTGLDGFVDHCEKVETVTVASGNPYLCVVDNILYNKDMTSILFYPPQSRTETIRIPDGVKAINGDTFAQNIYLKEVILPDSVTSIGNWAFDGCISLEKINIPKSCQFIGQYAFQSTNLSEIHIPAATEGILDPAFPSTLHTITVEEGNPTFYAEDNVLFSYAGALFCYAAKKPDIAYTIPSHVTDISWYAFHGAANLKEITIPEGIKFIGTGAFMGCTGITEIALPNTLTALRDYTFFDCYNLAKLRIPSSITGFGSSIFGNAQGTVVYGEAGSKAASWAKENGINFHDIASSWNVSGNCGSNITWVLSEDGVLTLTGKGDMEVLDSYSWNQYANNIKKLVIDNGITSVADYAFFFGRPNSSLTSIVFPSSLISIGHAAFLSNIGLRRVTLPEGIKTIKDLAFWQCMNLRMITLPDSVTQINGTPFLDCPDIVIHCNSNSTAEDYAITHGLQYVLNKETPKISLPAFLTVIEEEAFCGIAAEEIVLSEGVTSIGARAFADCLNLTRITLPDSVTEIAPDAFAGSDSVCILCSEGSCAMTYALQNGIAYEAE